MKSLLKYIGILISIILFFTGCTYKVEVKAGYEKQEQLFIGISEWPIDPIEIHIWKKDDIEYKCHGTFTKGYTSGGTIDNGKFNLRCIDGKNINGNWYSPVGQNNLIGQGEDKEGNIFHLIAGTQLNQYPNLEYDLSNKLKKEQQKAIENSKEVETNPDNNNKINYQPELNIIGTGTGFFVSNNGFLITNEHVVSNAQRVSLFINKELVECEVIMKDPYNDLALLKANIKSNPIPISKLNINKGAVVSAFGYPLITLQGNELKSTFGHITSLSGIKGDFRYYQIDTPIQPGNSGGPLINKYGEVIGVISSTLSQDYTLKNAGVLNQNVNYAIKIDYVQPILKQFNVNTESLKQKKQIDSEELVKQIEKSVVIVVSEGY